MESESSSAIGQIDSWPWRGSRMRPEMKDDAADDGFLSILIFGEAKKRNEKKDLQLRT
jgi:hypothetical protein